ncbi:hypothetical protein L484_007850 [Morus notabilis]|uniref:Retrotransposon gag domain-containing protein n=1 Tax=Morus notabilis TaxID=981085 RepID=W9RSC7_9ROSA|nr:hypothetical protein L484_007850 [Morus notabilis]
MVMRDVELRRRTPVLSWDDMRDILRNKYVSPYYMSDLLSQFHNLRQNTSTVHDYMSKFEDLMLRCQVDDEQRVLVTRFVNGLRADIRREPSFKPYGYSFQQPSTLVGPNTSTQPSTNQPPSGSSAPSTNPAKNTLATPSSSRTFSSQIECHHCHAKGQIVSRCPHRTLVLDHEDDTPLEDNNDLFIVDHIEPDYEEDPSVLYDDDFPFDEDYLSVKRCILSTPDDSDSWKRTSIFTLLFLLLGKHVS